MELYLRVDASDGMGWCLKLRHRRDFWLHNRAGRVESRISTDTA